MSWPDDENGAVLPFFNASLSRLFTAIRTLARNDFPQPLLVSCLIRRAHNLIQTFSPFSLAPTGYHPGYQTVQACERNDIELFGNLGPVLDEKLRSART